jgi:hypothetical protein
MDLDMGSAFFVAMYCVVPPFHTTKFCAVPSRAIVRVEFAVGKKNCGALQETMQFASSQHQCKVRAVIRMSICV